MVIHNPPQYRYSLFKAWDQEAFNLLKVIGSQKNYPKLIGNSEDKNRYLTTLIRTQKSLHDWRDFLIDTLAQIKRNGTIDIKSLLQKYPPESISKDVPQWVTYEEDEIVNRFIDELETKKINFTGTDEEISEFIMRFILGQLSHEWEQTIMMVWEMLGDEDTLDVEQLNKEMKNFDYAGIFK